ncbi:9275_t:CDS:2 [Dentiscutata heterogama]|uniref:9275_t:CDS:1 n=1 Tax=Dentiscutata heterogama TaxID=1316150 RepID=A0ACA9KKK2_9GLOM|nr:9275_t:CDS:2 [Dentiscutata heterogama]
MFVNEPSVKKRKIDPQELKFKPGDRFFMIDVNDVVDKRTQMYRIKIKCRNDQGLTTWILIKGLPVYFDVKIPDGIVYNGKTELFKNILKQDLMSNTLIDGKLRKTIFPVSMSVVTLLEDCTKDMYAQFIASKTMVTVGGNTRSLPLSGVFRLNDATKCMSTNHYENEFTINDLIFEEDYSNTKLIMSFDLETCNLGSFCDPSKILSRMPEGSAVDDRAYQCVSVFYRGDTTVPEFVSAILLVNDKLPIKYSSDKELTLKINNLINREQGHHLIDSKEFFKSLELNSNMSLDDIITSTVNNVDKFMTKKMTNHNIPIEIQWAKDEREFYEFIAKLWAEKKPDILIGYNICGYDYKFIIKRLEHLNMIERFYQIASSGKWLSLSELLNYKKIVATEVKISQSKRVNVQYIAIDRTMVMDNMLMFKQQFPGDTRFASLNSCLNTLELPSKDNVTADDMNLALHNAIYNQDKPDIETNDKILLYCFNDCARVVELLVKGGSVFDPDKGFYLLLVATLDFSSLYPSIMMQYNMLPDTKVYEYDIPSGKKRYVDGSVKTRMINITNDKGDILDKVTFLDRSEYIGSLTSLLEILIKKRNEAKKMKKQYEEGSFYHSLYDQQQLAFKILAGVISTGREQVHKLADFIRGQGCRVVYGDTDSILLMMQQARLEEIINVYVDLFRNASSITEYTKYLYNFYNDVTKETHLVASKIAKEFNELNTRDGCEMIKVVLEKVLVFMTSFGKKRYAGLSMENPKFEWDNSWCKTKRFLSQHFEIYNPDLVPDLLVENQGLNIVRCEASQFQKMFERKVLYNVYDYKKMAEYMYNLGLKTIEDYVNFYIYKGQYNWMRHCADQVLDEMIDLALSKDIKSNIIIFAKNAKVSGDKINITTICDKIQYKNFKCGWWKVRLGDSTLKYRNTALKLVDYEKGDNIQIKNFLNLYYSRNSDKKINGRFEYVIVKQPGIKDVASRMRLVDEFDPDIHKIDAMHYFSKESTFLLVCLGMEVKAMEMYIKQKIDKYHNSQILSNCMNKLKITIDIPDPFIHDL